MLQLSKSSLLKSYSFEFIKECQTQFPFLRISSVCLKKLNKHTNLLLRSDKVTQTENLYKIRLKLTEQEETAALTLSLNITNYAPSIQFFLTLVQQVFILCIFVLQAISNLLFLQNCYYCECVKEVLSEWEKVHILDKIKFLLFNDDTQCLHIRIINNKL